MAEKSTEVKTRTTQSKEQIALELPRKKKEKKRKKIRNNGQHKRQ